MEEECKNTFFLKTTVIILAALSLTCSVGVAGAADIYVPDDHTKIQWAVDNATAGDTIIVRDGTYTENVDVNKQLTIKSENGSASTIVNAATSDHVFEVQTNWVNLTGFTVTGATGWEKAGIRLKPADHCNISDNNVSGTTFYGIHLYDGNYNDIVGNTVSNNGDRGIYVYDTNNNITNNVVENNGADGIYLASGSNNVAGNTANYNTKDGIDAHSRNNDIVGNTVNNNRKNGIFTSYNNNDIVGNTANNNTENGIKIYWCNYNNVTNNIANNNTKSGIYLYKADYNIVTGNIANDNEMGIHLKDAEGNEITNKSAGNTVKYNSRYGFYLHNADDNEITCNLVAYNGEEGFCLGFGYSPYTSTGNNISYNSIIQNGVYNPGTGGWEWNFHNHQPPAVTAQNNYWGTTNSAVIEASIKPETGTVTYKPFANDLVPCAPGILRIEVNKTVWDPVTEAWVDVITGAEIGDSFRFRIEVSAGGSNFTNLTVKDTLSDSLTYNGSATTPFPPNATVGNVRYWNFSTLNAGETRIIEFDATVSYGGYDCNLASATALSETLVQLSDENSACIDSRVDLTVTAINAYHNNTGCPAWFNLSNEVDVTVKNNGTADADASNVSLYIDSEFFGKLPVSNLSGGENETVTFENWIPFGEDCLLPVCEFNWSYKDFNLTAIADCDNDVNESDETNNETTVVERACYNGYVADEQLENVAHGTLHGGLIFTTGDGKYTTLVGSGANQVTHYDITLPASTKVKFARLNVYYTWCKPHPNCPMMTVSVTNQTGTYLLPLEKVYNDIKCTCPGAVWVLSWGNYVYNLTDYVTGSGTYTVTVTNCCEIFKCERYSLTPPGIVLVYEDENAPEIEYWITEGADVLLCGRRADGGYLALEECITNTTFQGEVNLSKVKNATLGVVSPWAGSAWQPGNTNYLFFNDIVLGKGVYHGYSEKYKETINGITMEINSTNAQVGVNLSDVTDYLQASDNRVGQGDDGDNMMPCNAFLVVEYENKPSAPFMIYGEVNDSDGVPVNNPIVTITNLNTSEVFTAEAIADSNFYQVVTSSENVSAGNVLHFDAAQFNINHTVTQGEMNRGVFEQNITVVPDTTPPASITNLHNTTYEQSYINWSWTNPADADFNYTMVYIAGNWEENTSEQFYNATGLNHDTAYEIGTRTVDKAENINMTWVNHSARTAPAVPAGVCGDVTGDESVDVGDVILLGNHVRYPAKYPVDEWSADVNCDSSIDVGDVILLGNHVRYPAKYPLGCCS